MTQQIQTTSVIRDRGQLTIPDNIRAIVDWAIAGSVVTVSTTNPDKIIIQPYSATRSTINWNKIWRDIEIARSYKGSYKGSLSEFIAGDRENH